MFTYMTASSFRLLVHSCRTVKGQTALEYSTFLNSVKLLRHGAGELLPSFVSASPVFLSFDTVTFVTELPILSVLF
jgi:hypothetical protein